jgi:hypothetical protein
MRISPDALFRFCAIALCSALVASGCVLDRSPILPGWPRLEPQQFCPGDTVRASYDFLGGRTCPAGVDCTPFLPNVALSSTPASFSPTSFRGYTGGLDFTPAGDTVTVTFDIDRDSVLVPTDEFRDGMRVFSSHASPDTNLTARRITAPISTELVFPGMCAGATPTYVPASLETLPRLSPRLGLDSVCNNNGFDVIITLSGPGGTLYSSMVPPGMCLSTSMPGVPAGARGTQVIEARPLVTPPGTMCSATGPSTPPPTLRLTTNRSCG